MSTIKKMLKKYSGFIAHHPYTMIIIVILLTVVAGYGSGLVQNEEQDYQDMLPDDDPVINAFSVMSDEFGGSNSVMVALTIDPNNQNSNEVRDIRDTRVISYIDILSQMILHIDDVTGVNSPSTLIKGMNNGFLEKSNRRLMTMFGDNIDSVNFISPDYSMALIKISLTEDVDATVIVKDLQNTIIQTTIPPGLEVNVAGSLATDPVIMEQFGPDMQRTSGFSMFAIVLILLLLFRSAKYSFTPLGVIIIGISWTMGFIGLTGQTMSSMTSGAISMIMGIGIDFGIQIVGRFRQELRTKNIQDAIRITVENVFVPMGTTTLSALIGFQAMGWGQLSMMGELGTIMSYGVAGCFLAAITFVPSLLVIVERWFPSKNNKGKQKLKIISAKKNKKRKVKSVGKLATQICTIITGGN